MSARESAWLEHQRRRFMRSDAERCWRPDAARFMTPDAARQLLPPSLWPAEPQSRKQVDAADEAKRQRDYEIELARIKSDFAALRVEIALAKRARAECKDNFNPDQPRVPAGDPDGGQWTYGDGDAFIGARGPTRQETSVSAAQSGTQIAQGGTQIQIDPSALTGISSIDETTKKLVGTLGKVVDDVGIVVGQSPQEYGKTIHFFFAAAVQMQGIPVSVFPTWSEALAST